MLEAASVMDSNDDNPSLLGLHQDLLVKVLLQLEPRDLQSVSCSCKALALTDSPLWQSLFFHKWDVPRGSHLNYKKLYFRREQLLIYLESVCGRLKPQEEPSLQTLHDGRRVVGAGRFAALCPRLVEVVLTAMSVEKTTTTLLKHQVLSLAQLVVYVVFEEAMSTGNLTNANLLLITELSEALMWRLCGPASKTSVAEEQPKLYQDSTNLVLLLLRRREGPNVAVSLQSEELGIAAARLLAAQGMVKQGQMPDAGPVSGWPSPSASDEPSSSSMAPSGTSKRDKRGKLLKNHTRDIRRDIVGGGGQPEAGLIGRWMSKNSKQNATAGEKVAAKLARLSPKSLLTMLKKNAGLKPLPIAAAGETGPLEGLTGKWQFHNFSAIFFEAGPKPVTPFEVIPRAVAGGMQLQVDKNGQILGTAGDVLGGMHIKGVVQKFRHAMWGSQPNLQKKSSTPDLQRQSQTLPKEAGKTKPWQLARKSAPQPGLEQPPSMLVRKEDESRTSLGRVSFVAHVLRIRQHPNALPTYYRATVQYLGHVTPFGMSGVWFLEGPQQQEGVWSMYPLHKQAQQSFTRSASRAETGESGQMAGWDLYAV